MSFETMSWACDQAGIRPMTRYVLIQLARFRNARTGLCNPSQKTLGRACGLSVSTVNTHLRILEERGLIRRERRFDARTVAARSTHYSFPTARESHGFEVVGAA